jgi:hypothetical protein
MIRWRFAVLRRPREQPVWSKNSADHWTLRKADVQLSVQSAILVCELVHRPADAWVPSGVVVVADGGYKQTQNG